MGLPFVLFRRSVPVAPSFVGALGQVLAEDLVSLFSCRSLGDGGP